MKLDQFIKPESVKLVTNGIVPFADNGQSMLNNAYPGFTQSPSRGYRGAIPPIGPEMHIASDWVRNQAQNRLYMVQTLYQLALLSGEIRTTIRVLRSEVFRRGIFNWTSKFVSKCLNDNCEKEYNHKVAVCEECSSRTRGPDEKQLTHFANVSEHVNEFGHNLETVLRIHLDDVNIADDGFLLINNEYRVVDGRLFKKPLEVSRVHPALLAFDLNKEGAPKRSKWMCPIHRDYIKLEPGAECPVCGIVLQPVMYLYMSQGSAYIALLEDEVIHVSYYGPSATYGFSNLLTIFEKVLTLIGMDRFVYRYFFERKMPSAMLITSTDDPDSIRKEREYILTRLRQDPDYMPWVATSARTGRGKTELLRLYHTLQEMNYLPVRQEIRQRISGLYGVSDVWMNASDGGGGGQQGQSQQLVVSSRTVEGLQRIYNDDVLPKLLKAFGITDWTLKLPQPEERAESTRLEHMQQRVTAAQSLNVMGISVRVVGEDVAIEDVTFMVSGEAKIPEEGGPAALGPGMTETPAMPVNGTDGRQPNGPRGNMHDHDGRPPHMDSQPHDQMDRRNKQEQGVYRNNEKVGDRV